MEGTLLRELYSDAQRFKLSRRAVARSAASLRWAMIHKIRVASFYQMFFDSVFSFDPVFSFFPFFPVFSVCLLTPVNLARIQPVIIKSDTLNF